jgi:hypothetical protein
MMAQTGVDGTRPDYAAMTIYVEKPSPFCYFG